MKTNEDTLAGLWYGEIANNNYGKQTGWLTQYIIPLFIPLFIAFTKIDL